MSSHSDDITLPPAALFGVAALIGISLALVITFKLLELDLSQSASSAPIAESRDLRFVDVGGGEVAIYDWPEGNLVKTLDPGTDNFIRGVIRGMARERRGIGAGADVPFRLTRFDDGQLTLEDPSTGRVLVLEAYGATNARAFARLLETGSNDAGKLQQTSVSGFTS